MSRIGNYPYSAAGVEVQYRRKCGTVKGKLGALEQRLIPRSVLKLKEATSSSNAAQKQMMFVQSTDYTGLYSTIWSLVLPRDTMLFRSL